MEADTEEFQARPYQIDLYEKAVHENTIVYLPTGGGKTFVAVMLIKKFSADIQKAYSLGGKRSVFVVNTVALVLQQSKYISRHTGLTCNGYTGDMKVDFYSPEEWLQEFEKYQVLVMTSQILLDLLCHGYTQLNRINLIIFDECHSAVSDHPMRQIMKRFENCPIVQQPKVLGLTACLLNSNVKLEKVELSIKDLETTFLAKVVSIDSKVSVEGYCTNPKEMVVYFDPYKAENMETLIQQKLDEINEVLACIHMQNKFFINHSSNVFQPKSKNSKLINIVTDIKDQLILTGVYGCSKAVLLHLIQLECIKKNTDEVETVQILEYLITEMVILRKILENEMKDASEVERIHRYSSDQVRKVMGLLKDFHKNKLPQQKLCCIVFVEKRFTAKVLYHILKNLHEHDDEYNFLLPDFVVGFSNNPYKNAIESLCISKWNKEVLVRFRNGLSNCIIATEVVAEGIDLPNCSLIIRYNFPTNIRSYIQTKGRARHRTSQFIMLIPTGSDQCIKQYHAYRQTELYIEKLLLGNTDTRSAPSLDVIQMNLYRKDIKPYTVINKYGVEVVITSASAISVINRYISSLLKSNFVTLVATWVLHEVSAQYQVSLKLPTTSPVKECFLGEVMPTIVLAKRAAALKACIALHTMGELTDNLLPVDKVDAIKNVDYIFPNWVEENTEDVRIIGTKKKKRPHELQYPEALYSAFPTMNEKLYLHVLDATPTYDVPYDNRNMVFYKLLSNKSGFAILSSKKMPKIPSFDMFLNVGELIVDVVVNHATMSLTPAKLKLLTAFHYNVFHKVLAVIKSFMTYDTENRDNCFLVVPVNENWEIDWDTVQNYQDIEHVPPSTPFYFEDNYYDLALVSPSYRGAASVYVVTQVCNDLKTDSAFPTPDFFSYIHYYKERHGITIKTTSQPMLEVKAISTKINCIKPRSMKPGLSKRKRANILENFEEHLVPELCVKINFPALYWLKATMLPSMFHRISQLLIAEDLRTAIAVEAKLGRIELQQDEKWPPLKITVNDLAETSESLMETTFDDVLEISQPKPELSGPEVDVLNSDSNLYPWSKDQEPPDLDRNIEQIHLIDIEYYQHFINNNYDDSTNTIVNKPLEYVERKIVSVPTLNILTQQDLDGPTPAEIVQALTCNTSHDAFDFERLETLGDSYLKFIVSLYLHDEFRLYAEGRLTALKGKVIGNRNLYYCGTKKHIPGRMKVEEFIPRSNFIAPAYTTPRSLQKILLDTEVSPSVLYDLSIPPVEQISGCLSQCTLYKIEAKVSNWDPAESQTGMEHFLGIQTVADKTVADCVEALIGLYLVKMGLEGAVMLLKWFGILPSNVNVSKTLHCVSENSLITEGNPDYHMPWAHTIEERMQYKFNNRAYLLQAFTHASYTANNLTECYERLEFLGDAILDFLLTSYIYDTCGELTPGALTDLRSALVNNITFACLAVRHGLHTALLAYAPKVHEIIDRFVKFQEQRDHVIDDELIWILLEEEECNMAEHIDVPKILGDLYESFIGAVYLDSNKNLSKVWEIIYTIMHKEIEQFSQNVPKQPIRVIYETPGAKPVFLTPSLIKGTNTVMVPLRVTIAGKEKLFHGFGSSKKQAKCAAAKQALKSLRCKK